MLRHTFYIHSRSTTEKSQKLSLQPYTTRNCLHASLCVIESLPDIILTYLDILWLEVFFTSINTIFLYKILCASSFGCGSFQIPMPFDLLQDPQPRIEQFSPGIMHWSSWRPIETTFSA